MSTAALLTTHDSLARIAAPVGSPLPLPRVLVVFAHPDDEVLALGGRMERFCESRFLSVTDGAPVDGVDARAHGYPTLEGYRNARQQELEAALTLAGVPLVSASPLFIRKGKQTARIADKEAAFHLFLLVQAIASEVASYRPEAILTHPYEGGHPDHDSCAFAVHVAAAMMRERQAPVIVEAPFYHAGQEGGMETGCFLPYPRSALTEARALSPGEQARKQTLLRCFGSQQEMLAKFPLSTELYRIAPRYDFTTPPHAGQLLYESWGWPLKGERFRELAGTALLELQLDTGAA